MRMQSSAIELSIFYLKYVFYSQILLLAKMIIPLRTVVCPWVSADQSKYATPEITRLHIQALN